MGAPKIVSQDTKRQRSAAKAPLHRKYEVAVVAMRFQQRVDRASRRFSRGEAFLEQMLLLQRMRSCGKRLEDATESWKTSTTSLVQ